MSVIAAPVSLPQGFLTRPVAHRALHGQAPSCPENSRAAIRAAIAQGYAIEIDLQLSADGQAMVFHDYGLARLTGVEGLVRARSAAELGAIALLGGDGETIPTFREVLGIVAGQVPLLVEIKDQDGAFGPAVGPLEAAAVADLEGYEGPVALMSFNPYSIAEVARIAPHLPRGLTTCACDDEEFGTLAIEALENLREIGDFERTGSSFVSHQASDAGRDRVQALRAAGVPILCWTIRSPEQEAQARRYVDNVTFEGYLSPVAA